jgi:pyruvate/2-oxoglutarate dehydrogenase complex dihydrolipoamide dehydrogenase (E3) component
LDVLGQDFLEVEGRKIRFKRAAICTGARPAVPTIPGLGEAGYLTNESVFSLIRLPPRFAVIGGGPLGCELAQAFARFGSEVSLLEYEGRVLSREDPDAAMMVQNSLLKDGVKLFLKSKTSRGPGGQARRLSVSSRGDEDLVVDEVLWGSAVPMRG